MYKSKDGKVIASLTEVKNKTGDIFTLVDEFGEVILTSYNKPRYKIQKIGVADILETASPKEEKKSPQKPAKKDPAVKRVAEKVKEIRKTEKKVEAKRTSPKKKETGMISSDNLAKLSKLKNWNRFNKKEQQFTAKAKSALQ